MLATAFGWSPEFGNQVWDTVKSGDFSTDGAGKKVEIARFSDGCLAEEQRVKVYDYDELDPMVVKNIREGIVNAIYTGDAPGEFRIQVRFPGTGLRWNPFVDTGDTISWTNEVMEKTLFSFPHDPQLDVGDFDPGN